VKTITESNILHIPQFSSQNKLAINYRPTNSANGQCIVGVNYESSIFWWAR